MPSIWIAKAIKCLIEQKRNESICTKKTKAKILELNWRTEYMGRHRFTKYSAHITYKVDQESSMYTPQQGDYDEATGTKEITSDIELGTNHFALGDEIEVNYNPYFPEQVMYLKAGRGEAKTFFLGDKLWCYMPCWDHFNLFGKNNEIGNIVANN